MKNKVFWCKECTNISTRPRLTFDEKGVCSACNHHKKKHDGTINWKNRWQRLVDICNQHRNKKGFNVLVPCSGGKDGSYVAWQLKHHPDLKMNPLCITFRTPLQSRMGRQNLENFVASGFDHILISPDAEKYRKMCKHYFIEQCRPKWPFVMAISTAIMQFAINFDISMVMLGEEGEGEYGGISDAKEKIDRDYLTKCYYEGNDPSGFGSWWELPSQKDIDKLFFTHWSKFEQWDPDEHARFAKEKAGLELMVGGSIGTFTSASQLDCDMQDLHAFTMFIKFAFGRCTSDSAIEIRHNRMSRSEGVKIVNEIDGQFPVEHLETYLDYFEMSKKEFWETIKKYVNFDLLKETKNIERPYVLKERVR